MKSVVSILENALSETILLLEGRYKKFTWMPNLNRVLLLCGKWWLDGPLGIQQNFEGSRQAMHLRQPSQSTHKGVTIPESIQYRMVVLFTKQVRKVPRIRGSKANVPLTHGLGVSGDIFFIHRQVYDYPA